LWSPRWMPSSPKCARTFRLRSAYIGCLDLSVAHLGEAQEMDRVRMAAKRKHAPVKRQLGHIRLVFREVLAHHCVRCVDERVVRFKQLRDVPTARELQMRPPACAIQECPGR
jgi:hypothetical protein